MERLFLTNQTTSNDSPLSGHSGQSAGENLIAGHQTPKEWATFPHGAYQATPINQSDIPSSILNIDKKFRSNPFAWNGQFSPQFIQALIAKYASPRSVVFDPFLGSGTVLLEAGHAGLTACGTEINPAAVMLSTVYRFINLPVTVRQAYVDRLNNKVLPILSNRSPSYVGPTIPLDPQQTKASLLALIGERFDPYEEALLQALIVLLDFYDPRVLQNQAVDRWHRLIYHVLQLPYSPLPIIVYHSDARNVPVQTSAIDLVITSPPYINVINYHQQYRQSVEVLRWDLLDVAKSEFGSNRKNRGNRFLTVVQYCLDIAQTLEELIRICKEEARIIFVVGRESTVRGAKFRNGEIVTELACAILGCTLSVRQERVFRNRFGVNIYEDILHFTPPRQLRHDTLLDRTRVLAREVLLAARYTSPDNAQEDLESALSSILTIHPSPRYRPQIGDGGSQGVEYPNA